MKNCLVKNNKGFSLIEIISVLLLVGLIAAIAGAAIVQGVQGFFFAKENIEISQKAQLALNRMTRELSVLTDIDVNSTGSCIRYKSETISEYFRVINISGTGDLELWTGPADQVCPPVSTDNYMLADNVNALVITYVLQGGGNLSTLVDLADLYAIDITLTLNRDDGITPNTFSIRINPRNTGLENRP